MAIGGTLDANNRAIGRAGVIQNDSATIESLGNMSLATGQLLNRNLHLRTEEVQVAGSTAKIYIQPEGEANKYDESELRWDGGDGGNYHVIATGQKLARYTKFYVTRSEFETQVKASDPARIRAGGNITLSGDNLTNDNSHMLAGGALLGICKICTISRLPGYTAFMRKEAVSFLTPSGNEGDTRKGLFVTTITLAPTPPLTSHDRLH